jgi:toxin ParE1/3/4
MKLRFTPRAAADLIATADYLRQRNPGAAISVRATILESLQLLLRFPRLGRTQSVQGVRRLVTRKYGYIAYYKVDEEAEEIVVLTIQHPARNRPFSDA